MPVTPAIGGPAGESENTGSLDGADAQLVRINPKKSEHKDNPHFDSFQNSFIGANTCEFRLKINTFV
jgi:hypothetical protein